MDSIRQIVSGILLGLISLAIVIGGGILAASQTQSNEISITSTELIFSIPTINTVQPNPTTVNSNNEITIKESSTTNPLEAATGLHTPVPSLTLLPSLTIQLITNTIVPQPSDSPTIIIHPSNTSIVVSTVKPTTQICGAPSDWINYLVLQGDTLSGISYRYQVSISELQSANCLGVSENIYTGTYIKVPNVYPIIIYPTATPYYYSNTPIYEIPSLTPVPATESPNSPVTPTPFSGIG